MTRIRKVIVIFYCLALIVICTYVPWGKAKGSAFQTDIVYQEHRYLFFDRLYDREQNWLIDYKIIFLEATAVTGMAVVLYLLPGIVKRKP